MAQDPGVAVRLPGAALPGRRRRRAHRHPEQLAPGRAHQRARRPAARRRAPRRDARLAGRRLRRRRHGDAPGPGRQDRRPAAALHRHGRRAQRAAPDGRVPLALGPARLRGVQPALDRRRLRRRRARLPGGSRLEPARRRRRGPDRVLRPPVHVRDPVRPLDGLQRLPAVAHPRGVPARRRAASRASCGRWRASAGSSSPPA